MTDIDFSEIFDGLDKLGEPEAVESLARTMAFAGGTVIKEEAQLRAPVHLGVFNTVVPTRGATYIGELSDNIILIRNKEMTTPDNYVYTVTWRRSTVWWAIMIEMTGYHINYKVHMDEATGMWFTVKDKTGSKIPRTGGPKFMPPKPFLGPAFDARQDDAIEAMLEAGRKRFDELFPGE